MNITVFHYSILLACFINLVNGTVLPSGVDLFSTFAQPPFQFLIQSNSTGKCLGVVADFTVTPALSNPRFLVFKPLTCDSTDVRQAFYYSTYSSTIIKVGKPESVNLVDIDKKNFTQQNWCMNNGQATNSQQVYLYDCFSGSSSAMSWEYDSKLKYIVNKAGSTPSPPVTSTDKCLVSSSTTGAELYFTSNCNSITSTMHSTWTILRIRQTFQTFHAPSSPMFYIGSVKTVVDGITSDSVCVYNPSYIKTVAGSSIPTKRCGDVLSIYGHDAYGYNVVMTYDSFSSHIRTFQPLPKGVLNCLTANLNDRATFTPCNPSNSINQQWVLTASNQIQLRMNPLYCLTSTPPVWSVRRCTGGNVAQIIGNAVAEFPVKGAF